MLETVDGEPGCGGCVRSRSSLGSGDLPLALARSGRLDDN